MNKINAKQVEKMKIAISAAVRAARTRKGMTQEELAQRADLTNHTICVMEKVSGAQCSLETLTSVCAVLGMKLNLVQPAVPTWGVVSKANGARLTEDTFGSEEDAATAIASDANLAGGVITPVEGEEFTAIVSRWDGSDDLIINMRCEPTQEAIIAKIETSIMSDLIASGVAEANDSIDIVNEIGYTISAVVRGDHDDIFDQLPSPNPSMR